MDISSSKIIGYFSVLASSWKVADNTVWDPHIVTFPLTGALQAVTSYNPSQSDWSKLIFKKNRPLIEQNHKGARTFKLACSLQCQRTTNAKCSKLPSFYSRCTQQSSVSELRSPFCFLLLTFLSPANYFTSAKGPNNIEMTLKLRKNSLTTITSKVDTISASTTTMISTLTTTSNSFTTCITIATSSASTSTEPYNLLSHYL